LKQAASGALYFAESCHSVSPQFRPFFENNGGLLVFGYPISEAYIVSGQYFVQIYERAVIVWDSARPVQQQFQLANLGSLLESVNYKKILARGFALVKDVEGKLITSAATAKTKESLIIMFADGEISVDL
jgi:hypothetical protein